MIKADIVINPQSKTGKWKYKSNNKTITAFITINSGLEKAIAITLKANMNTIKKLLSNQSTPFSFWHNIRFTSF